MSKEGVRKGPEPHPGHLLTSLLSHARAIPGGLRDTCPQPRAGPRGPQRPPGRSQVSGQWGQDRDKPGGGPGAGVSTVMSVSRHFPTHRLSLMWHVTPTHTQIPP